MTWAITLHDYCVCGSACWLEIMFWLEQNLFLNPQSCFWGQYVYCIKLSNTKASRQRYVYHHHHHHHHQYEINLFLIVFKNPNQLSLFLRVGCLCQGELWSPGKQHSAHEEDNKQCGPTHNLTSCELWSRDSAVSELIKCVCVSRSHSRGASLVIKKKGSQSVS